MSRPIALGIATFVLLASTTAPARAAFINGGFESPGIPANSFALIHESSVPGWSTTAADGMIEFWHQPFNGVPAFEGAHFAELNANLVSTLYQDASGIAAGSQVGFSFAHRGRLGVDTLRLTIADLGANGVEGGGDDSVLFSQAYSTGSLAWSVYTNPTSINALGNILRFSFESVSAAGGSPSHGNFLDAAEFGEGVGNAVPAPAGIVLALTGVLPAGLLWTIRRLRLKRAPAVA